MAITPQTNLKLLKCPLQLDNKNQLTFANSNTQFNYFNNLPKLEVSEISYQRHNSTLMYDGNIDELLGYNYCMYQNSNYDNKWFYAFIVNMRWISEYTTEITLVTDVFQTWQFDFIFRESFIEREMLSVQDDVPRC